MARFRVYKVPTEVYESKFNTKYNYVVDIDDNSNKTTKTCTVEDFFELASVVKEFANELKQTEIEETRKHIAALEERLAASKKALKQLEEM